MTGSLSSRCRNVRPEGGLWSGLVSPRCCVSTLSAPKCCKSFISKMLFNNYNSMLMKIKKKTGKTKILFGDI